VLFEKEAQRLADEVATLDRKIRGLTDADAVQADRALTCRDLAMSSGRRSTWFR